MVESDEDRCVHRSQDVVCVENTHALGADLASARVRLPRYVTYHTIRSTVLISPRSDGVCSHVIDLSKVAPRTPQPSAKPHRSDSDIPDMSDEELVMQSKIMRLCILSVSVSLLVSCAGFGLFEAPFEFACSSFRQPTPAPLTPTSTRRPPRFGSSTGAPVCFRFDLISSGVMSEFVACVVVSPFFELEFHDPISCVVRDRG